jgi:uncharacterized membrane protein YebE (DUF533 family)
MSGFDLVGRLLSMVRGRDGRSRALEELALRPMGPHPLSEGERSAQAAIGTKVLEYWLANRRQTLVPYTLNLRVLTPEQAGLIVAMMAAAAQADGQVDPTEARRIPLALQRLGAGEVESQAATRALDEPQDLGTLLARVQEEGLAAHAYAAALLAIDRQGRVNRAFLDFVAARLGLLPHVAASLERRYRA